MKESIPESQQPVSLKYNLIISLAVLFVALGIGFALVQWADDPDQVPVKSAEPQAQPPDLRGLSMAGLLGRAEAGDIYAQGFVAECYRDGTNGFPKDDVMRFQWALKAAKQGHPRAKVECGICYFHGIGTSRDFNGALAMFVGPARDYNDDTAQFYMGCLNHGFNGFPARDDIAAEWFRRSAEKGNAYAAAEFGKCLMSGRGVTKDVDKAIKYIKVGVDGDVPSAFSALGWAYRNGEGVEKDLKQAVRLYRTAAEKGDPYGCMQLGLLYRDGEGVIKDAEQAMKWLKIASNSGYDIAKKELGNLYQSGVGVPQDLMQASRLYLELAISGDVECQRVIGVRYQHGLGLPIDPVEAYAWYNIGASSGDAQSAKLREEIAASLSAEKLIAAQKRSRELLKDVEAKKTK